MSPSRCSTCIHLCTSMSQADVNLGATAALEQSLLAVKLDDSIERISVSSAGKSKSHASLEHRTDIVRAVPSAASPSSSASVAAFGPGRNASARSSPTSTRYQNIIDSPNWRKSASFVRQSAVANDDPFVSDMAASQPSTLGKHGTSLAMQQHVTNWSSRRSNLPSSRR